MVPVQGGVCVLLLVVEVSPERVTNKVEFLQKLAKIKLATFCLDDCHILSYI